MANNKYLSRILRGEERLVVVFWFGYIINLFLKLILSFIMPFVGIYSILLLFVLVTFNVLLNIAVWRSANNYKGASFLQALAKFSVCFNYFFMVIGIFTFFGSHVYYDSNGVPQMGW